MALVRWEEIEDRLFAGLDWSQDNRSGALGQLFKRALVYAQEIEDWYTRKRRIRRRWGRRLRVTAIMLGSIAALLPVLSEIYTRDGQPVIAPAWATVALILAATVVGLDRFFGFSTGWMRFMAAELKLARNRHEFEGEWAALHASSEGPASDEELDSLLECARKLVREMDEIVLDETGIWTAEFQSALDRAEQAAGHPGRRG